MNPNALESIPRYAPADERLATAGQPSEAQLEIVARAGFGVVVNLALHDDPRYSLPDEAATVAALGMQYIHIPVRFSAPTLADLTAFFQAMDAAGNQKVLVHCAHNKRVPVFLALYRIVRQGWDREVAFAQMRNLWQPDPAWESFIAAALSHHAA